MMTAIVNAPQSRFNRHSRRDVRKAASVDELLHLAGPDFGFRVEARPAHFLRPDGSPVEAPGQVIVRTDTEEALSLVGEKYVPAQVTDFLAPLDSFLRSGELVAVSATSFDRGLTQAIELQLPRPIVLPGPNGTEDVLLRRVLWKNSHDGSSRLSLVDSLLRQWCKNGATHVIGMMGAYFRHTARKIAEALDLREAIAASQHRFELVEHNAQRLLATPFTRGQMSEASELLFPAGEEGNVSGQAQRARDLVVELFSRGTAVQARSAWDAFNAVTEYATHARPVRAQGEQATLSRLRSIWQGDDTVDRGMTAIAHAAGLHVAPSGELLS